MSVLLQGILDLSGGIERVWGDNHVVRQGFSDSIQILRFRIVLKVSAVKDPHIVGLIRGDDWCYRHLEFGGQRIPGSGFWGDPASDQSVTNLIANAMPSAKSFGYQCTSDWNLEQDIDAI